MDWIILRIRIQDTTSDLHLPFRGHGEKHSKQSMIGRLTSVRSLFNCHFVTSFGDKRGGCDGLGGGGDTYGVWGGIGILTISAVRILLDDQSAAGFHVGEAGDIRRYLRTSNLLQFCIKYIELGIHQRSPCTTQWSDLPNQTKRIQARKYAVEAVSR